jgi:hypothetical protein
VCRLTNTPLNIFNETLKLWECAGNHKHDKRRVFQVLPEEAFMYARFRPVDIRAAKCMANEEVATAFLNLDQQNVGTLKRYLVDCIGSENIGSWTERSLDEGGLRDLHIEVQTLASEVNSCEAILGPFLSAVQAAKNDISPMFQECLDQAGTSCNQDQFAMIMSKTGLDLKLTYKLRDTCEARGRTLSIMQRLLDSELRKNVLFKYEEDKERKPTQENNVVG